MLTNPKRQKVKYVVAQNIKEASILVDDLGFDRRKEALELLNVVQKPSSPKPPKYKVFAVRKGESI